MNPYFFKNKFKMSKKMIDKIAHKLSVFLNSKNNSSEVIIEIDKDFKMHLIKLMNINDTRFTNISLALQRRLKLVPYLRHNSNVGSVYISCLEMKFVKESISCICKRKRQIAIKSPLFLKMRMKKITNYNINNTSLDSFNEWEQTRYAT